MGCVNYAENKYINQIKNQLITYIYFLTQKNNDNTYKSFGLNRQIICDFNIQLLVILKNSSLVTLC